MNEWEKFRPLNGSEIRNETEERERERESETCLFIDGRSLPEDNVTTKKTGEECIGGTFFPSVEFAL